MDEDPVRASILNGEIIVIDDFFQNESSEFLRAYIDKLEYSEKANYAGKSVTLSEDDHQKVLVLFER